jgi:hypothetical protein
VDALRINVNTISADYTKENEVDETSRKQGRNEKLDFGFQTGRKCLDQLSNSQLFKEYPTS